MSKIRVEMRQYTRICNNHLKIVVFGTEFISKANLELLQQADVQPITSRYHGDPFKPPPTTLKPHEHHGEYGTEYFKGFHNWALIIPRGDLERLSKKIQSYIHTEVFLKSY